MKTKVVIIEISGHNFNARVRKRRKCWTAPVAVKVGKGSSARKGEKPVHPSSSGQMRYAIHRPRIWCSISAINQSQQVNNLLLIKTEANHKITPSAHDDWWRHRRRQWSMAIQLDYWDVVSPPPRRRRQRHITESGMHRLTVRSVFSWKHV